MLSAGLTSSRPTVPDAEEGRVPQKSLERIPSLPVVYKCVRPSPRVSV